MPNIPQEYIIAIVAALIVWILLKIVNEARALVYSLKPNIPAEYEIMEAFRLGWDAGEQLIKKHGYTDLAKVEAKVLEFVNQYMIAAGHQPPARAMAEMLIKAVGKRYNEQRKEIGEN